MRGAVLRNWIWLGWERGVVGTGAGKEAVPAGTPHRRDRNAEFRVTSPCPLRIPELERACHYIREIGFGKAFFCRIVQFLVHCCSGRPTAWSCKAGRSIQEHFRGALLFRALGNRKGLVTDRSGD